MRGLFYSNEKWMAKYAGSGFALAASGRGGLIAHLSFSLSSPTKPT
jgi:hypothetical protein